MAMKEDLIEMKASENLKWSFVQGRYLQIYATQHFPSLSKHACAIFSNLFMWKRFLNSLARQN